MSKKTCLAFILTAAAFISCSLFPSHAQEYPCVTLTGDADGNGIVNIDDPTLTQRVLADFVDLSPERTTAADCNRNGVVDVTDVTLMQQYVADMDTRGETVSVPVGLSELLPAYCLREAERVKNSITSEADENDVVFGIFTDTHFSPDDTDLARTQKLNAVRAMRRLADIAPLDFVIQGGDLVTYGPREHDEAAFRFVQETFSGCRAPLLTAKGDHDSAQRQGDRLTKSEFAALAAQTTPRAVRCEAYPNNYYFDLPAKKTRVICLDTGTIMAGQSYLGEDFSTWTHPVLYNWLLDATRNGALVWRSSTKAATGTTRTRRKRWTPPCATPRDF